MAFMALEEDLELLSALNALLSFLPPFLWLLRKPLHYALVLLLSTQHYIIQCPIAQETWPNLFIPSGIQRYYCHWR